MAHLLYGAGLRVSEPLELRLKDVDMAGHRLVIRGAKGGKDLHNPVGKCPQKRFGSGMGARETGVIVS